MMLFTTKGAGFQSTGAFGIDVAGDLGQHGLIDAGDTGQGRVAQSGTKRDDGADGVNEAEPQRVFNMGFSRGLQHQGAYHVQRRQTGGDLFANTVGTLTAQYIGTQGDLDFSEEGLDAPSTGVKSDDLVGRIAL